MIQDITGQPQPGVIGGMTDLETVIKSVNRNFGDAYEAKLEDAVIGQGKSFDPVLVAHAETINADTKTKTAVQAVPTVLLVIGAGIIIWALVKG